MIEKTFKVDKLLVKVYTSREEMGKAAAQDFITAFKRKIGLQSSLRLIFAAAPSQNEFLENLVKSKELPWESVTAFHMDEYLGLENGDPRLFREFLKERIFSKLNFGTVHYLTPDKEAPLNECRRYTELLQEKPIDLVALGIGENGHIAFNDPPFALFDDPEYVKVVELEEVCRQQQVNDGAFNND